MVHQPPIPGAMEMATAAAVVAKTYNSYGSKVSQGSAKDTSQKETS